MGFSLTTAMLLSLFKNVTEQPDKRGLGIEGVYAVQIEKTHEANCEFGLWEEN